MTSQENGLKNKPFALFAILSLVASSLAGAAFSRELGVSDIRMALDQAGQNVTSTFSPTDVFYVVADLADAPRGTKLDAKWIAIAAADTDPNSEFQLQTLEISQELFTGSIYFQLSTDASWPVGQDRVDLYLNDALLESSELLFLRQIEYVRYRLRNGKWSSCFCIYKNPICFPSDKNLAVRFADKFIFAQ